ncbi:MAG: response regulator [Melioribacteraceae bacterium]|nr:response regulator [Melioribacteraceae bacterium]MCF8356158.1 response regulator [Melioribacteraceae bacterium]MCF8392324.1 response regulator [Melioribacteraceae bacterium]MCF8417656.1 response regulator [Melioribacteraceae bacterium]
MSRNFDILIIDDEQVILDSVVKTAKLYGLTCDTTSDVKVALKKLEQNSYRLIISDIMMPVLNGFELLKEIEFRKPDTPVVLTTGYSSVEHAVKSLYSGAIGFIPKPFSIEELSSIIHRGLKYGDITKSMQNALDQSVFYVPCPAKYYRLGYSCWLNIDSDEYVTIGATDFYLKTIGNFNKIEMQEVNESISQGSICTRFISEDEEFYHHLLSSISGRIIERNDQLLTNMSLIEKDPYFNGWLYKIIPDELDQEIEYLIPCSSDRI